MKLCHATSYTCSVSTMDAHTVAILSIGTIYYHLRGFSFLVPIFHRRGPPSPSLGISVLSKRLSNELVVRSQYGLELVVWLGPATNWIVAPTVARARRPLSNERDARKRTKEHRSPQPLGFLIPNLHRTTANSTYCGTQRVQNGLQWPFKRAMFLRPFSRVSLVT